MTEIFFKNGLLQLPESQYLSHYFVINRVHINEY